MLYKLLSVNTPANVINIGDYIQALASSQFLPQIDGFVSREALDKYDGEECVVVMNGWFMHNPLNWPPSKKIHPLFIAFHINAYTQGKMFTPDSIAYLKQYEPIGCRDYTTSQMLSEMGGVKTYFSGCMTLTLGEKFYNPVKDNTVYFVDPYFKCQWTKTDLLRNLLPYLRNKKIIDILSAKISLGQSGIKKKLRVVDFYKEYSKYFTTETLRNSIFISQQSSFYNENFSSDNELLTEAERLVRYYAKASLVVTSRIHCALPCLGLQTPVIYIENASQDLISSCRLQGLRELFNIMKWKDGHLIPLFAVERKFSKNHPPQNKTTWIPIADKLKKEIKKLVDATI